MSTKLTDERLCSWLDSDNLTRERLSLAIIKSNNKYKDVYPVHPRGGPDKGRDIEAILNNEKVIIAVGFLNSANDSNDHRKKIIKKFESDLKRAKEEFEDLHSFVFITNVNLTMTQKEKAKQYAKSNGISFCDIYDRELIRILLDSPDGFVIRYQYLGISLSETEQVAFFTKWGDALQNFISKSFESVDEKLSRIQFLQEANRPLRSLNCILRLKDELYINDSSHFRIVMVIMPTTPLKKFRQLHIGACDVGLSSGIKRSNFIDDGIILSFWEDNPKHVIMSGSRSWNKPVFTIIANGGYSEWDIRNPMINLCDLDECHFGFFVNESLARIIRSIEVNANDYLLWFSEIDNLHIDEHKTIPLTPWDFTPSELKDKWVRIMPSSGVGFLSFGDITPKRIYHPKPISTNYLAPSDTSLDL